MNAYALRVFDAKGQWFSTKHVKDYTADGENIAKAIREEFAYWEPGSVSKITVDDSRGTLRTVKSPQSESIGSAIARRLIGEDFSLNPDYTTNAGIKHGDSSEITTHVKKEGEEYQQTGEEKREVAIADKILAAAGKMAKTADVEEVIRLATELKKMHGV